MSKLSVKIAGVEFKNPIIAASGTFGFGEEFSKFYDLSNLGGISLKGLTREPREGNMSPRIAETPMGMLNSVGLQNPGVDKFLSSYLPEIVNYGTILIANIAGNSEEDYIYMAQRVSDSAIDMIELNISCPNVKHGGAAFGVDPKGVEEITAKVKAHAKKPLIVKLTPNVSNIADNAKAAEAGGADAISLINTVTAMAVDYKTRRPILANVTGGLSGPCVKPIALRMVWQAYQAVSIPIIGIGGIRNFSDVLEFMLCGASAVQVGAENLVDPYACVRIAAELEDYLDKNNIADIHEYIGGLIL